MDWHEIITVKPDKITEENRESIFDSLVRLDNFDRADNKSFRKLFRIAHKLLQWKGEEVLQLRDELQKAVDPEASKSDVQGDVDARSTTSENNKLRKLVERLENERSQQKIKFRQLSEEIQVLQKRSQNISEREDSPDALSDLDKHEELLNNISMKNKHIKRLLSDLEELEGKNAKTNKDNQFVKHQLHEATLNLESLSVQFKDAQMVIKDQMKLIEELNEKNNSLDEMIQAMQRDFDDRDGEITAFGKELEQRVTVWKRMFDSKQNELESLKIKYEDIIDRHPGYNIDAERAELTRLTVSVKERDCLINDLEEKVFEVSNELMTATEVINKLLMKERDLKEKTRRPRSTDGCCSEARDQLALAKRELLELQDNIVSLEEENIIKTKQAMDSVERLAKYENGEEGLPEALKRITQLEQMVRVRDKDIKELVKQINRSQDVARENIALREQVGIDESEIVPTTFVEAKQRKLEKANERLTLKLRASEEMRLKMKLERNELMKQLRNKEDDYDDSPESDQQLHGREDKERIRMMEEELRRREGKWRREQQRLEENYEIVLKEAENLRMGMHEILYKLRDCEGTSNEISVDSNVLNRLLDVLDKKGTKDQRSEPSSVFLARPAIDIPKSPGESPKKSSERKKSLQEIGSQTQMEPQTITSMEFEDLLTNLKGVLEENSSFSEELIRLRLVNRELQEQLKKENGPTKIDSDKPDWQSKCEFLSQENVFLCQRLKESQKRLLQTLSQTQKKFVELKLAEGIIGSKISANEDEFIAEHSLSTALAKIKAELCKNFFDGCQREDLWKKIDSGRKLDKVAVIEEDLKASNFITNEEYQRLIKDHKEAIKEKCQLESRNRVLEETLKATKDHLELQQSLENWKSDEEISLRHLVVDLQSSGSEKQLIARAHRDLAIANEAANQLREENDQLQKQNIALTEELQKVIERGKNDEESNAQKVRNTSLKLIYLRKTVQMLHEKYCTYTPLIEIEAFVVLYKRLQEESRRMQCAETVPQIIEEQLRRTLDKFKDSPALDRNGDRIDLIRWSTQCELLSSELKSMKLKVIRLEDELHENRVQAMKSNQHWMSMKVLLEEQKETVQSNSPSKDLTDVGVQVAVDSPRIAPESVIQRPEPPSPAPRRDLKRENTFDIQTTTNNKCLESQLKQAMILASTRSALLLETENRLAEAQGRLKGMERCLEERERLIKEERGKKATLDLDKRDENIFSITIASLQNLLLEKDTTLSRYQELLKTERMEHSKSCAEFQVELEAFKVQTEESNRKMKERETQLEDYKKLSTDVERISPIKSLPPNTSRETDIEKGAQEVDTDDAEISFNLLDSAKFEEVFIDERKEFELAEKQMELQEMEEKLNLAECEINRLQQQLVDVSNRERGWDAALAERDLEIESLQRKLKDDDRRSGVAGPELGNLDELKEMLEEKDRHIHDLSQTLTHFHDDQQNYLKDTTLSSAEDMARLTSELSRAEASNKVLNTQIEALTRQMTNLEQRERQAREIVKTLKEQLIKRPVISVGKTMHKEDQYQRKIETLQADLRATKDELRKQTNLAEQRRSKGGQQELQMWEKQKRAQQTTEKVKIRLAEREQELEKVKCQLAAARQTVSRMEREKQLLEGKRNAAHSCQSPSCPSQHQRKDNRRPAAETPETDNTEGDEEENYYGEIVGVTTVPKQQQWQEATNEVVKALKARIEIQQRKIVAMELEGKGTNVLSQEMEKLQERLANLESQNIRLEAKNLQLQLESDLLKKGDESTRQQRQIKHLEDYVLVLKEELSQAVAVAASVQDMPVKLPKGGGSQESGTTKTMANMEQTILALKRIVERLRLENKALKEGKTAVVGSLQAGGGINRQKTQQELKRVQDLYSEALNKISSNEICRNCKSTTGTPREGGELKVTMIKLEQKTQLLEKAKLLLTRAAAKEKNLREQIEIWKRKCSELQNVPVIDEISE